MNNIRIESIIKVSSETLEDTIITQQLRITSNGNVFYKAYNVNNDNLINKEFKLNSTVAKKMIYNISDAFECAKISKDDNNLGSWSIAISINNNKKSYSGFKGVNSISTLIEGMSISEYIRKALPINNLYLFDEN